MSEHEPVLSSEQALDDYFSALLDEEFESQESPLDLLEQELSSEEPEPEPEPEPELKLEYSQPESYQYHEVYSPELEAPNLEDVQRLLSQLESTNVVAELDIDDILEQNTIDIASETKHQEVEVEVAEQVAVEEEIQEWTIEEPSMPDSALETVAIEPVEEIVEPIVDTDLEAEVELDAQAGPEPSREWESTQRSEDFQVLYFDVNGVTFAVPLDELGGIHRIAELNHLIGRPDWYLGLQTSRENQYDVVDTAKWVMPDKLSSDEYKDSYEYVVMLGESMWGLASNQLLGTETLNVDKVRWREQAGKRPWLAGMVKEKMCALIHVHALIGMLNAGLDVKSLK
ncbi:chemotaxis protein CheW [Vibrio rotiferianus]|uniref:chemotaxis protein CheW n=1 Tax=Vibrio rotiferianus TaxID=190895 RepID=UPI0015F5C548|nr:chemotaxis protein CheW [Vibrio rotiferianus]